MRETVVELSTQFFTTGEASMPATRVGPAIIKGKCNWSHAVDRGSERYDLSPEETQEVGRATQAHFACGIPLYDVVELAPDREYKNRRTCAVYFERKWIPVSFDVATNTPVTVLPPHTMEPWRDYLEKRTPAPKKPGVQCLLYAVHDALQSEPWGESMKSTPKLSAALSAIKKHFAGE